MVFPDSAQTLTNPLRIHSVPPPVLSMRRAGVGKDFQGLFRKEPQGRRRRLFSNCRGMMAGRDTARHV
jgi:hypothetical protein